MSMEWPQHHHDLYSFDHLSRFRKVGAGAFGCVHKASLEGHQTPVAVKVLTAEAENSVQLFTREAMVLQGLDHKNIVRFVGLVNIPKGARGIPEAAHQKRLAIIQEYLQGETLQALIMRQMISSRDSVYDDAMALEIAKQVADGLLYLQKRPVPIIHRDLTTANVMTTKNNGRLEAHIIDFGISRETRGPTSCIRSLSPGNVASSCGGFGEHKPKSMLANTSPTRFKIRVGSDCPQRRSSSSFERPNPIQDKFLNANSIWLNERAMGAKSIEDGVKICEYSTPTTLTGQTGSFMYMAPEVYCNRCYNERADIYSYGIILFELFTRAVLIATETAMDSPQECIHFADKVLGGYRPKIPSMVPDDISNLIRRCWDGDQRKRPTIQEIIDDLKRIHIDESPIVQSGKSTCLCM